MQKQLLLQEEWTEIIQPKYNLLDLRLSEVWRYRDLVMLFVRRDFVANYKQTILGPIWFFLQPLFTTLTYLLIFGRVAGLSTDGAPMIVFYMSGIIIWNYFSESLTKTANVFRDNANIFGKVYFPRLVMPLSIIIANQIRFLIQFILFLFVWGYFNLKGNVIHPNLSIIITPLLVLLMGLLALGIGMIISALTTKYRDLALLLTFGIQLLMFATPIIYPLASVPEKYRTILVANPMGAIVETFRYAFLGTGTFSWMYLGYSFAMTTLILIAGIIVFNKVEKGYMDTI